ncbi:MAG: choice-of-anchor D domain-containing protein [Deltaproteobacteria bacterium]|nr:choice-of-anchor D domain-containing protein [Deltaproteobacteria bacterium]
MNDFARARTLLLVGLSTLAALPRCSCEGEPDIGRAAVEMQLSLVEIDPCSNAAVPRRIPDDYDALNLSKVTDLGSRAERVFEIRSTGSAPLKVSEVLLSEASPEFQLAITDAADAAVTLPVDLAANPSANAPPGLIIRVSYAAADANPDLVNLIVRSSDAKRSEVQFGLAAGRGKLEVCGTNGCTENAEIQFGQISRGSSDSKQLTIRNTGMGDLDLRDVRLESTSTEFCAPEVTALPEGVTGCALTNLCKVLKPGEEYVINISYAPVDGGTDTGVIRIVSGDAGRGTVEVPINGVGAGPAICACVVDGTDCRDTAAIDFGAVGVGTSVARTVRLVSCGTENAGLTEADLETAANNPFRTGPEFQITRAFAAGSLAPSAFAEGEITYTPAGAGEHRGGLRFTMAPDAKSWIALLGRAATCDLEALPASVNFGAVAGSASADRTVVLVNNGARDCSVSAITDPTNGFAFVNKPALPLVVPSGQSANLTVRYTSPARATPTGDTSSFDVTSDEPGPGATNTVQLSAQGGGTPVCNLDVQPSGNALTSGRDGQLNFGATNIGYSKVLAVRITNTGNSDCVLQSFNLTTTAGTQFRVQPSSPVPAVIGPGGVATLDVTFAPTGPASNPFGLYGPLTNHLDFNVAGSGLTKTMWSIGLNARPTVPTIDVIPEAVDFGLVTWDRPQAPDNRSSCGSETRTVRVYNSGTGALEVTAIRIDQTSDPVFLISGVTNGGTPVAAPYRMTIQPGGNAEVQLRFYPTRVNPAIHVGLLVVENNVTTESTVPLRGEGTSNSQQTDQFSQLRDNKVDVLWVVDNSGSMDEEQTSLGGNFSSFISYANTLGADYQVGVVTTDVDAANQSGKLVGNPKIVTQTTPNASGVFQNNTAVGTNGSGSEAGLQAAKLALSPPVRDAENAGFLRADARLAVIVVSDEEDQSPGSISLYVDFFRNIKGFRNPQLTSVSAIAGDVPNGCATAEAGQRYYDAVSQLGGQYESICSASWSNMLQNLGLGVFALREAWTLSRPADPNSVSVRVNGMNVPQDANNGWTYDAASNSIVFHGSAVPPAGANVDVQYGAVCIP